MKNFENEYKELIQEDMPDLWDRIEAGLVEKKPAVEQTVEPMETVAERKRPISIHKLVRYAGLAAACLCVVILTPVIIMVTSGGAGDCASSTMEMATATDKSVNMEAAQPESALEVESAPEIPSGMVEGSIANDVAPMEGMTESALSENSGSTVMAPTTVILEDGTTITDMQLCILSAEELNYHTVYRALVESDASGNFQTGDVLEFLASNDIQVFAVGESYTVTLTYEADAQIPLHLTQE